MIPDAVQAWCEDNGYGKITSCQTVGGGCINNGARITTSSGETLFLKTNAHAPENMFGREAEGLGALQTPDGPRVPEVFCYDVGFILMEDLAPAPPTHGYWVAFGRSLAALHNHTNTSFGFDHDNYIGSTPQSNTWEEDGFAFFGQQRLMYQADLARRNNLINENDRRQIDSIVRRLPDLVPPQPASLIHGDLWSGNAITDGRGEPALIDPAVHYGWGEAELGMTALFGRFPDTFYNAYVEVRPLEPGWQNRLAIYNLYHVLNHVNLFGTGYLPQTRAILQRYA